jgi:hypothetical protein
MALTCLFLDPASSSLRFRAVLYAALGAVYSIYFICLRPGFIRPICSGLPS